MPGHIKNLPKVVANSIIVSNQIRSKKKKLDIELKTNKPSVVIRKSEIQIHIIKYHLLPFQTITEQ